MRLGTEVGPGQASIISWALVWSETASMVVWRSRTVVLGSWHELSQQSGHGKRGDNWESLYGKVDQVHF